ncbi:MAG: tape measure protein [Bacilli bacterium]
MDLFKISAKIGLETKEYERELKKATKKAEDFTKGLSNGILKGLGTLAKGVAKVGTIAGTGISVLGGIGVKYNADMESYTTNFKVMLGSQEKAIKKVEELKTMAAKTPFGMAELADATQVLLSFGMANEEVTPTLKMIGDVSLGNKEKFKSLSLAFAQVQSSGKLMGQDLLQMVNQGFNPLQVISEMTGKSMVELKKDMENGAISADMVSEAFAYATSEEGKFYNGMDEASKTTDGLMSTLKDDALAKTGELFGAISEKLKELIPKVIEFIAKIDVKDVVKKLGEMWQKFVDLLPIIVGVTTSLLIFAGALKIVTFINGLKKALDLLTLTQIKLNLSMNLCPIILIVSLIAGLITAIVVLWNTNEGFRNALINAWEAIKNAFKVAGEFIAEIFNKIKEFFKDLWVSIKEVFTNIKNFFVKTWNSIVLFFTEGIPNFINSIIKWFKELPGKIWNAIIKTKDKIVEWVSNLVQTVKTEIPKFFNSIVNKIKELPGEFLKVGKNLVTGLVNGVKEKIDWAKNKVKKFFGGITEGVMNIFKQQSPSRVFKTIGINNDKGFVNGILEGEGEINRAINKVYGGIGGNIGIDINSTAKGINGMISATPTYINLTTITNLDGEVLTKSTEKVTAKKNLQYQFS